MRVPPATFCLAGTAGLPSVALFGTGAQWGGKLHPELIKRLRPIDDKYCEGKMKRTLERELKVPEVTVGEVNLVPLLKRLLRGARAGAWTQRRGTLWQARS